jgi:hypothetical protein
MEYYFPVLFLNHHLELFTLNSVGYRALSQSGPALMVFFGKNVTFIRFFAFERPIGFGPETFFCGAS